MSKLWKEFADRALKAEKEVEELRKEVARLKGARAQAFREAAEMVYISGWNDVSEYGNLRDHSHRLKYILQDMAKTEEAG